MLDNARYRVQQSRQTRRIADAFEMGIEFDRILEGDVIERIEIIWN